MTHSTTSTPYAPELGKVPEPGTVPPAAGPRRPVLRRLGGWLSAVVFTVPALALFGLLVLVPMGYAFYVSFFDWGGFGSPTDVTGFGNYTRLFEDPVFLGDLWRGGLLIGFSIAMLFAIDVIRSIFNGGRFSGGPDAASSSPFSRWGKSL